MTELEFLTGEAQIASASAPSGCEVVVKESTRKGAFDVMVGEQVVSRLLSKGEALACIMGIGGAFMASRLIAALEKR